MLFLTESGLIDIVRESIYTGVLTVRSSNPIALTELSRSSQARIVRVPDQYYPWVTHIPAEKLQMEISQIVLQQIEIIERLTPPPIAYVYEQSIGGEGGEVRTYGYCWPSELSTTKHAFEKSTSKSYKGPVFLPLFQIPKQLLGEKK